MSEIPWCRISSRKNKRIPANADLLSLLLLLFVQLAPYLNPLQTGCVNMTSVHSLLCVLKCLFKPYTWTPGGGICLGNKCLGNIKMAPSLQYLGYLLQKMCFPALWLPRSFLAAWQSGCGLWSTVSLWEWLCGRLLSGQQRVRSLKVSILHSLSRKHQELRNLDITVSRLKIIQPLV